MKSTTHNSNDTPWYEHAMLIAVIIISITVGLNFIFNTGLELFFDKEYIDSYGSFIGGVGGLCSVYHLYKTLKSQNEAQQLSSFETRYIQLITFNRNMMNDISIELPNKTIYGKECFQHFNYIFERANQLVEKILMGKSVNEIYKDQDSIEQALQIWGSEQLLIERTKINISYLITFIGVKEAAIEQLKSRLNKNYKDELVSTLILKFRPLIEGYDIEDISKKNPVDQAKLRNNDNKIFKGFQHEFGNYYRLLFQIFTYLNDQLWLSSKDRYTYAKMLRSQLSDYEELLLFYNSLSDYGLEWEYTKTNQKEKLITLYKLIKNIPYKQELAKKFYPLITFEKE